MLYESFDLFSHTLQNCYKKQKCTSVALIFGTNEERVTVDSHTKFALNQEYPRSYEPLFM